MSADILTSVKDWSATAASNQPDNADAVGPNILAENQRTIQAVVRAALAGDDTIASATTCDIGAKDANYLTVSGVTTITGFGTVSAGIVKTLKFDGALTLTHNVTSLILPGAASITTVAGDVAVMRSEGSGNWRCIGYFRSKIPTLFVDFETPTGVISGSNRDFTLAHSPAPPQSLQLFLNGLLLRAGTDYTLTANAIQYSVGATPQTGDNHYAYYRY